MLVNTYTISQLLDLALRVPEIGAVNFNILHTVLKVLIHESGLAHLRPWCNIENTIVAQTALTTLKLKPSPLRKSVSEYFAPVDGQEYQIRGSLPGETRRPLTADTIWGQGVPVVPIEPIDQTLPQVDYLRIQHTPTSETEDIESTVDPDLAEVNKESTDEEETSRRSPTRDLPQASPRMHSPRQTRISDTLVVDAPMPSKSSILARIQRGEQTQVISEFWRAINVNRRLDGAEEGLQKLSYIVDRLVDRINVVDAFNQGLRELISEMQLRVCDLSDEVDHAHSLIKQFEETRIITEPTKPLEVDKKALCSLVYSTVATETEKNLQVIEEKVEYCGEAIKHILSETGIEYSAPVIESIFPENVQSKKKRRSNFKELWQAAEKQVEEQMLETAFEPEEISSVAEILPEVDQHDHDVEKHSATFEKPASETEQHVHGAQQLFSEDDEVVDEDICEDESLLSEDEQVLAVVQKLLRDVEKHFSKDEQLLPIVEQPLPKGQQPLPKGQQPLPAVERKGKKSLRKDKMPVTKYEKSLPEVGKSRQEVEKSLPEVEKSLPEVEKPSRKVAKSLPEIEKPMHGEPIPEKLETFPDVVEAMLKFKDTLPPGELPPEEAELPEAAEPPEEAEHPEETEPPEDLEPLSEREIVPLRSSESTFLRRFSEIWDEVEHLRNLISNIDYKESSQDESNRIDRIEKLENGLQKLFAERCSMQETINDVSDDVRHKGFTIRVIQNSIEYIKDQMLTKDFIEGLLALKADKTEVKPKVDRSELLDHLADMSESFNYLLDNMKKMHEEQAQINEEIFVELKLKLSKEESKRLQERLYALMYGFKNMKAVLMEALYPEAGGVTKCVSCSRPADLAGKGFIKFSGDTSSRKQNKFAVSALNPAVTVHRQLSTGETSVKKSPLVKERSSNSEHSSSPTSRSSYKDIREESSEVHSSECDEMHPYTQEGHHHSDVAEDTQLGSTSEYREPHLASSPTSPLTNYDQKFSGGLNTFMSHSKLAQFSPFKLKDDPVKKKSDNVLRKKLLKPAVVSVTLDPTCALDYKSSYPSVDVPAHINKANAAKIKLPYIN